MTRAKFDHRAYYTELERRVCALLYTLDEQSSLTRFAIGRELFDGGTGSTVLASVIGTLLTKGYIERRLPAFNERGPRFRLSGRGRLAYELMVALDEAGAA